MVAGYTPTTKQHGAEKNASQREGGYVAVHQATGKLHLPRRPRPPATPTGPSQRAQPDVIGAVIGWLLGKLSPRRSRVIHGTWPGRCPALGRGVSKKTNFVLLELKAIERCSWENYGCRACWYWASKRAFDPADYY